MNRLLNDWFGCCAFAPANPAYFCALAKATPDSGLLANVLRIMADSPFLWGDPARAWEYGAALGAGRPEPVVRLPRHVFPVFLRLHHEGMIVPLEISPSRGWEISDAFGTFAVAGARSPAEGFFLLLRRLEQALDGWLPQFVPLRWRRPYSLRIACALHFHAIEGESLQLPLLVAVLREAASIPFSQADPDQIPFGAGPVFSIGRVADNGEFVETGGLEKKLAAYLREFPSHAQAILTGAQLRELEKSPLLRQVRVLEAGNLDQLVRLAPWKNGIEAIAGPPHPTEIDRLFDHVGMLSRSVEFSEARLLADRLLPHAPAGPYRLRLLMNAGMSLLHSGSFTGALEYLSRAEDLLEEGKEDVGADDRANLIASVASALLDAAEPEHALRMLERIGPIDACTLASRVRVMGTRSQLERMLGNWDAAVTAAEQAVCLADTGFASEAGRDRNYLVHALLRRASVSDIRRAEQVLRESLETWAPQDDLSSRRAHIGFCQQYEAEIARLRCERHIPAHEPPWTGTWGHTRIFVLLNCARNHAHSHAERISYARRAESAAAESAGSSEDLFRLIHILAKLYTAWLDRTGVREHAVEALGWCRRQSARGWPGWERRFNSVFRRVEESDVSEEALESVLAALPYL